MKRILQTAVAVVGSWRFIINFVVILLITSWVPLLSQTVTMSDDQGNVMHEAVTTSRVYQSWAVVLRQGPGMSGHLRAVALHAGMCFAIAFAVWFLALYSQRSEESIAKGDIQEPDSP